MTLLLSIGIVVGSLLLIAVGILLSRVTELSITAGCGAGVAKLSFGLTVELSITAGCGAGVVRLSTGLTVELVSVGNWLSIGEGSTLVVLSTGNVDVSIALFQ